jgi:sensor c-di-GMP phosphodiesterase-like protein
MVVVVNRRGVIAGAIVLGLIGVAVPLAGAWWYSWRSTVDWERESLADVAEQGLVRAGASMAEITDALQALDGEPFAQPCDADHVDRMQLVAFETRTIAEIGFFADDQLKCTSWGVPDEFIPQLDDSNFTTADGVAVTVRMQPLVTGGREMMAFQYRSYNALVDPADLVDVIVADDRAVTVATDEGIVLSELHTPTAAAVEQGLGSTHGVTDDEVFAAARSGELIAVATEPRDRLDEKLADQRRLFIPVALTIGAVFVAVVVWASRRRLSMVGELGLAVRRRQFVVHYQPLIELATERCIGAEALVRWQRPDGTMVRPDLFIPIAEETGMIEAITDQVIEAVGRDLGDLLADDRDAHIAINLCAHDVKTGRALEVVRGMCERYDVEPEQIWLEATESGFVDVEAATPHLERARAAGHKIAIDDFGTGYSTLSHLQRLPVDVLKIDKSFVDTIATTSATSSVTGYIIDMAATLGLDIVAEGVETAEQAEYLRAHGVRYAQGWLFARALPPAEFLEYHRQHQIAAEPARLPALSRQG